MYCKNAVRKVLISPLSVRYPGHCKGTLRAVLFPVYHVKWWAALWLKHVRQTRTEDAVFTVSERTESPEKLCYSLTGRSLPTYQFPRSPDRQSLQSISSGEYSIFSITTLQIHLKNKWQTKLQSSSKSFFFFFSNLKTTRNSKTWIKYSTSLRSFA